MLAAPDLRLDAVDVACPREHHAGCVRRAVAAGLAVFCQKPLAPTWAEARALVDGLPAGARLMVHENWRHRPHYATMRDWIAAGRIGRLRQVLALVRTSGLLPDAQGELPALARQPMLAGLDRMLLMEVMIHHVDALRSLVGEMRLLGAVLGQDSDALRGEDRASLLFDAGGVAVSLLGDFRVHGAPPLLADEVDVQGTRGAIVLSGDRLILREGPRIVEEQVIDLAADYATAYRAAIAAFLDSVGGADAAALAAQVEDNLRTLKLVEEAYAGSGFRHPRPPGA
jgi:predicted dehydrogenase